MRPIIIAAIILSTTGCQSTHMTLEDKARYICRSYDSCIDPDRDQKECVKHYLELYHRKPECFNDIYQCTSVSCVEVMECILERPGC